MGLFDGILGGIGGLVGSFLNNKAADDAADQAWDRQKKVLTKQIQWRVADAQKAGIHPLAALGVNPASGPPMANISGGDFSAPLAEMGQDIGRAAEAYASGGDKATARMTQLSLERGQLENDLLRTQIASQRARLVQQGTPGVPGTTRTDVPVVFDDPTNPGNVLRSTSIGDQAESAFGDGPGDAYGWANWWNGELKKNGYDPKVFWSNPYGQAAQIVIDGVMKGLDRDLRWYKPRPRYGGSSTNFGRWGRR